MGHSMKRKEDPRFIRGQGNYVDDIVLPGMLYMDIVRSPFAHAKIVKIDATAALKVPGVLAVITGETLAEVQAALDADADVGHADGAADREGDVPGAGGRGGDRHRSLRRRRRRRGGRGRVRAAAGRRRSRTRRWSRARSCCAPTSPDKKDNHIWHWEAGDRAATEQAFADADGHGRSEHIYIPRIHVASIETCGCVATSTRRRAS